MPKSTYTYPAIEKCKALWDFLMEHNARCLWQAVVGKKPRPDASVEGWMVKGGVVVVIVHANGQGWDAFTSSPTNDVAATLEDVKQRLSIKDEPK